MQIFNLDDNRSVTESKLKKGFPGAAWEGSYGSVCACACVCVVTPPATAVRFPSLPDMQQRSQTHTAEQSKSGSAYKWRDRGGETETVREGEREEDRK